MSSAGESFPKCVHVFVGDNEDLLSISKSMSINVGFPGWTVGRVDK